MNYYKKILALMADELDRDTIDFLEDDAEPVGRLFIRYGAFSLYIPLDYAETNNAAQEVFKCLSDACDELDDI